MAHENRCASLRLQIYMKAVLIHRPSVLEIAEIPVPVCAADQVVVRTAFCGLCGTDLEILHGALPEGHVRYPVVPGHEWTGVVEDVGSTVQNLRKGDRVSVEGYLPCGHCSACQAGEVNRCQAHEQIGMTHNGGLAEFVVAPAESCHIVPDQIGLDEALMVEPASTVVRGIERAKPEKRIRVAIIGCGTIGLVAARVIQLYEPERVLGIDLFVGQASLARQAGMDEFTVEQNPEILAKMSGQQGWDLVINCAQGLKPMMLALDIVRSGGCVVFIGGVAASETLSIPANLIQMKDLHVEGIFGYTTASWKKTLELVASGRLKLGDLITHRKQITEIESALKLVQTRTEAIGKITIQFS